jgi:23S rRNA pseudouridine2605 synthase
MTDRSKGRSADRSKKTESNRTDGPRTGKGAGAGRKPGKGSGEQGGGRPASKRAGKRPPAIVRSGDKTWEELRQDRRGDGPARPPREARAEKSREEIKRDKKDRKSGRPPGVGRGHVHGKGPRHKPSAPNSDEIRLNRYLAQSGVCSRREADDLIKAGVVTVNGVLVTELGTKVKPTDKVHYGGQRLSMETKRYVLLNKPKDFITTTDDPRNRRTVMALVDSACPERIYPVGRLDRHTTGLLLMTNDGDLAKKLTHPSHGAEKIYHVTLDKSVTKAHLNQLVEGVVLEDGPAKADEANHVEGATKREVGIKIHMGRNRVVRRMFAALGYEVMKLDRVVFAGLTKKDLPRGKWRHLTENELLFLSKRK